MMLNMHSRPLTMLKFNRDGDMLYSAAKDSKVFMTRTETGEILGMFDGHKGAIFSCDVTLDGLILATASADGTVKFWNALNGECVSTLEHGGICKFVEWNTMPYAQNKIVTANDRFKDVKDRVCVWHYPTIATDPDASEPELVLVIDRALPMKCTKCAWGPFDETLISLHDEGTVFIWNSTSGEEIKYIQGHRGPVTDLQFTPDRMMMLTSSKDKTINLWSLAGEGKEILEKVKEFKVDRPLNTVTISPLAFSENPKDRRYHILCGGGQEAMDVTTSGASSGQFEAVLLHMITDEDLGTVKGHFGPMNAIRFFPDGKGFATGGEDGYVRIHHFDKDYFNPKKYD